MWFQYEPSQFSVGQTAQSQACSIMEKPHTGTGLHDCLKILLLCFRARMSGMAPNFHTWLLRDSCWGLGRQNRCAYGFYKKAKITCFSNFQSPDFLLSYFTIEPCKQQRGHVSSNVTSKACLPFPRSGRDTHLSTAAEEALVLSRTLFDV